MNLSNNHQKILLLSLCLSGIASISYQIIWVRLLSFTFGSSSISIAVVLAIFFLGLSIGSALSKTICQQPQRIISYFIVFELVIAISGLILFPILLDLSQLILTLGLTPEAIVTQITISFLLLAIPTICIGASFPFIATLLDKKDSTNCYTSKSYAINTFGAVLGALLCGFYFIPDFGLDGASYIAASVNIVVASIVAIKLGDKFNLLYIKLTPFSYFYNPKISYKPQSLVSFILLFSTGFITLSLELILSKYLSIFTGATIYGLSIILASFLMGLSLGAYFISKFIKQSNNLIHLSIVLFLSLLISLFVGKGLLYQTPIIFDYVNQINANGTFIFFVKSCIAFILVLPTSIFLGALFPVNIKIYSASEGSSTNISGAYAINTFAGIFGALISGLWIIPTYSSDILFKIILLIVILCLFTLYFGLLPKKNPKLLYSSIFSSIIILLLNPSLNYKDLIDSVDYRHAYFAPNQKPRFLYLEEGKNSVISLITYDNKHARLQSNGLSESMLHMQDTDKSLLTESLLAYIPYFLHENPKSAFVIGYGGGITTRAFTHTDLMSIHVTELEEKMISAVKLISDGPATALNDNRITISINDARNSLISTNQQFDIISSQPSHPWTHRAANVFTQEFFNLANTRLSPDGVYSQWLNLFRMDNTAFKSIIKAYYSVFQHGFAVTNIKTGDIILIGSNKPLLIDVNQIEQRINKNIKKVLFQNNIQSATDIMIHFSLSRDQLVSLSDKSIINRDTNLFSETRLSKLFDEPIPSEDPKNLIRNSFTFDISSYLPEKRRGKQLYQLGTRFIQLKSLIKAQKVALQLNKIDKTLAKRLLKKIYWAVLDENNIQNAQHTWTIISEQVENHHIEIIKHLQS